MKYQSPIRIETMIAVSGRGGRRGNDTISTGNAPVEDIDPLTGLVCWVDGSWKEEWFGGLGFVLLKGNRLMAYRSASIKACSPLQAEALALQQACRYAIAVGEEQCLFLSDCQLLVSACTSFDATNRGRS